MLEASSEVGSEVNQVGNKIEESSEIREAV